MFELIIKYANGSVYWREYFKSMDLLNAWLALEQTRSYWLQEFTTQTVDHTPVPLSQEVLDAREAVRLQIRTLKIRIKTLASQNDLTAAELKEAVIKFLKILDLQKNFDT